MVLLAEDPPDIASAVLPGITCLQLLTIYMNHSFAAPSLGGATARNTAADHQAHA